MSSEFEAVIFSGDEFRFGLEWFAGLISETKEDFGDLSHVVSVERETGKRWRLIVSNTTACSKLLEQRYAIERTLEESWIEKAVGLVSISGQQVMVFAESDALPLDASIRKELQQVSAFLDFSVRAAAALSHLHEKGFVHAALRPNSILLGPLNDVLLSSFDASFAGLDDSYSLVAPAIFDLAYAAPEQARRDRPYSDRRSDLYSLGVILYEILTGELPLKADSVAGWLHAHIAMEAKPLYQLGGVPDTVERIVMKLISKDPDLRYQTAHALRADLLRCVENWTLNKEIGAFDLGRADPPHLKLKSETLFGRSVELRRLAEVAMRVANSSEPETVLISGAPGAGKSALVARLPKLVGRTKLEFATGKSDQLLKDIPFAPFSQILVTLILNLLSASGPVVHERGEQLSRSLGGNSGLLLDLVPEAEFVLPPPTRPHEAPGNVSQARMIRVITQAIAAFATADTPLVLCLDDVQWADDSTLGVLKVLIQQQLPNLLLIICYRDVEVGQDLPEILTEARLGRTRLTEIALNPLTTQDTADFIANILDDIPLDDLNSLAELVQRRTGGNAFYVNQFIRTLIEQSAISFDLTLQRWTVDQAKVAQGSDIIDFLIHRLQALSTKQQEVMRFLALLGGQAEPSLIASLCDVEEEELEVAVQPLFNSGLLTSRGINVSIAHDRVLETAYRLTAESDRPIEHSHIAKLLLEQSDVSSTDRTFQIAHQIEQAAPVHSRLSDKDRISFIRVLVTAARRVRNTGAVKQAIEYLEIARSMAVNGWNIENGQLMFEVDFLYCECLINIARLADATAVTERLFALAVLKIDRANIHRLKAVMHTVRSDYENAIAEALAGLNLLDVTLNRFPSPEECDSAYELARTMLSERTLPHVVGMPEATSPEIKTSLALLSTLSSSFFVEGALAFLHVAKIVELSLIHGVVPETAYGLAWFGVFSASRYGVYSQGYDYAAAAAELVLRPGFETQRTGTLVAMDQITPWTRPIQEALSTAREAAKVGYASDDLGMTCYARNHIVSDLIAMGTHLTILKDEADESIALIREVNYDDIEFILRSQAHFVQLLMQGEYARLQGASRPTSIPTLFWVDFYEGMGAYYFGDEKAAISLLTRAMEFSWSVPAHIDLAYGHLFTALALSKLAVNSDDPEDALLRLDHHRSFFLQWTDLNPSVFGNKLALLDAEIAALRGEYYRASIQYETSVELAEAAGFVHEQALAHELAGAFYERNGLRTSARSHIHTAHACYSLWGADGKASQLQSLYPAYFSRLPAAARFDSQAELDLEVVVRSSQALSEEIVLERVVGALMRDMIIHAGAQYGVLLMMHNGQPVIEASGRVVQQDLAIDIARSEPTAEDLAFWILNAVVRKKKSMVFADAFAEAPQVLTDGPTGRRLRSVMCLPLIKRGSLVGVMYLENNLAPGVFNPSRVAMLEILAPQAAISLDAARLYRELTEENVKRAKTEADLMQARAELARTSQLTLMGGLAASIAHEINQPLASIVSNADASKRWLKRDHPDLHEALLGLESIRESGIRAASIVKALRSLAKQSPMAVNDIDLSEIVREVIRLTSPEIDRNKVQIETVIDSRPNIIRGDAVQLQQVILNLVTNAMDALTDLSGERRKLRLEISRVPEEITLRVIDRGTGIPPETVGRIFDPFFSTKAAGMGMGLAICQSILEAHGSRLQVRSIVEEGTTFFFSLPAVG